MQSTMRQIRNPSLMVLGAGLLIWVIWILGQFGEEQLVFDSDQEITSTEDDSDRRGVTRHPGAPEDPSRAARREEENDKSPTSPTPPEGGDMIVVVGDSTGLTHLEGMHIEVECTNPSLEQQGPLSGITNQLGRAIFSNMPVGEYLVILIEGSMRRRVSVHPRTTVEVGFSIKKLNPIHGLCLDELGNPVADAKIYVHGRVFSQWSSAWATSSGADGSFTIPHAALRSEFEARKYGMGPSAIKKPSVFVAKNETTKLVLTSRAAQLKGTVTAAGKACAGVEVILNDIDRYWLLEPTSSPSISTMTDAKGVFEFECVRAKTSRLMINDANYASYTSKIRLAEGSNLHDVRLLAGATVRGTLRDSEGDIVGFNQVFALDPNGRWKISVESSAKGQFTLDRIPPGQVVLESDHIRDGFARTTRTLSAGQVVLWNPKFESSKSIKGRIVFDNQQPLKKISLRTKLIGTSHVKSYAAPKTKTDNEGKFILRKMRPGDHEIKLESNEFDWRYPQAGDPPLAPVNSNQTDILIELPWSNFPSAFISGSVSCATGNIEDFELLVIDSHENIPKPRALIDSEPEEFCRGPYRPGQYDVSVRASKFGFKHVGTYLLSANQDLNLGKVFMDEPGSAILTVDASMLPPFVSITLYSGQHIVRESILRRSSMTIGALQPGHYRVVIEKDSKTAESKFEIKSGIKAEVSVSLK